MNRAAGLIVLPLLVALATSGCVNAALTKAIVQAPNRRETPYVLRPAMSKNLERDDHTYAAAWNVHVTNPDADLAVAVVEPGQYGFTHTIKTEKRKDGRYHIWPQSDWTVPATPPPFVADPKATLLVLHGYQDTKEHMLHWALYLAQAGFRVVLVDLRGHGRSTGDWIGYGAFEVRDLQLVLDDLQKRGLASGPVGVLGISYGASVGLQLAGHDERIRSVIALEPFSQPRTAVVDFARAVVPKLVRSWTADDFTRAEDRAARMAHLLWSDADVLDSVARTKAAILYVTSEKDHWVSPENTQRLAEKTTSPHAVMTIHFTSDGGLEQHVLLSWILDPVAAPVVKWLDESLLHPGPDLQSRLNAIGALANSTASSPAAQN
jgi:pimeloyl-ACP methyl ester carboxylesterase